MSYFLSNSETLAINNYLLGTLMYYYKIFSNIIYRIYLIPFYLKDNCIYTHDSVRD